MKRPLKPVNPKPRAAGKDYVAEAELYCRTSSTRVLDEYIERLRKQLETAEAIRAERKVVETNSVKVLLGDAMSAQNNIQAKVDEDALPQTAARRFQVDPANCSC